ncbi:MAG: phosphatidate cytidylyltransferase [Oxalobacter sp.]|nr:MAG: phosphatidate cytidylyltransferase [Oxalobacter sp.]
MLKTRVITSIVLFGALVFLLFSGWHLAFEVILTAIFAIASWECFRLFGVSHPIVSAVCWSAFFPLIIYFADFSKLVWLLVLCVMIWALRFAPTLKIGIPPLGSLGNRLLMGMYSVALLTFFVAMYFLYRHSPIFLLSIVSIIFIADIGAYSFGKTLGRHKLAPKISPSKTWEGAVGGWVSAMVFSIVIAMMPIFHGSFMTKFQSLLGWFGMLFIVTVLAWGSVVGDLFESRLKRRAGVKDSSNLLPGHGGILDRIDALLPVLPLACLLDILM